MTDEDRTLIHAAERQVEQSTQRLRAFRDLQNDVSTKIQEELANLDAVHGILRRVLQGPAAGDAPSTPSAGEDGRHAG